MEGIRIPIDTDQISDLCRRWQIKEFALFGSVLEGRKRFRDDSDVDVMLTFEPLAEVTGLWIEFIRNELQEMFGREVHLVTREGIERDWKVTRRRKILNTAKVVYTVG
jgi:predicted nucleotidyltransferase